VRRLNRFGELLKTRRQALGFTQRLLADKLGVEPSHVAFIESGRRKPSLKLVARIADALGINRQELVVLAHPEVKVLLSGTKPEPRRKPSLSWQRFSKNSRLLTRYHVTKRELQVLEQVALLGTAVSEKGFLAILMLIRDIPETK
jgi:transcriptional regulator with XRE-family HTH domain